MKNLYAVLVLVFCSFVSNAQIVNIPDPVFKNLLVNTICADTNGGIRDINGDADINNDGEIQVSEALAINFLEFDSTDTFDLSGIEFFTNLKGLDFFYFNNLSIDLSGVPSLISLGIYVGNVTYLNLNGLLNLVSLYINYCTLQTLDFSSLTNLNTLYVTDSTISSLDLSNLQNLKFIMISGNGLTNLSLEGLSSLEILRIYPNSLTSLDLNDLVSLKEFFCYGNQLSSLDLSNSILLEFLECSSNQLTSIDVSSLTNLLHLSCGENHLTNLDVSNLSNLNSLYCANNQLTNLDTTNLTKLSQVYAGGNLVTSLDFSNIIYNYEVNYLYDVSNSPNLTSLNIKNGARISTFWGNYPFSATNCPNLTYICSDEFNFQYINVPNAQINSYCSFNPGGNYNTITGTFSLDNDNNGCDINDYKFSDSKIKIDDASNIFGATYTNTSGKYSFFTQSGNFIITPVFENPYFTVSPASATVTIADSNNNTQTQNFCVTPNGVHNDVEVSVLPVQRPRPGFDATYQLTYKNKGNQVLSGNVNLAFNDAVLDFVAANPALATQSLNTLSWSYANLLPFESRTINFTLNVNSPQEIPAVNNGDVLSFSASIDPISGDETVNDNTFALTQIVSGSYDPNDKTCLEGNTIVPERIGEYLHYLIRFQNSGTAAAENIVVKDIIDTTKFDITSLQLTSASHNYTTKITGNKVEFIFENINLPAEIDNEAASHGFVAFKIKTKNNLTAGNSVSNKADIYFDYNFPITTNEATTTFATLGVNQIENKSVAVFPNPVQDILTITSKGNLTSIQLLDVQGRLIATYLESEEKATINLSDKVSGVYFVKIFTEKGVKLEKIVKK